MGFLNFTWQTYVIAGLVALLLTVGLLYKSELRESGQLSAQIKQKDKTIATLQGEKEKLYLTLENSENKTVEDMQERDALKSQVVLLNKKISSLTELTKPKGKAAQNVKSNLKTDDDVMLSDSLISVLRESYCATSPAICVNPQNTVK